MLRFFVFVVALAGASPAQADWQYSRWGMSPEEVVTASSGTVRTVPADPDEQVFDLDWRAVGRHQAAGIEFEVRFFFTPGSDRLAAVKLIPGKSQCDMLRAELQSTYGPPDETSRTLGLSQTWRDREQNNWLLFADIAAGNLPRLCHVVYRPIRAPGSGL